jgi:aspyridone synthetase, hybrid polyketide synthase / nonribosomal peptide synthetase
VLSTTPNTYMPGTDTFPSVPKGVKVSQANFLAHMAAKTDLLSIKRETVLQQSSLGFDMSITQTFTSLANGGTLVIAPASARGDPIALSELMAREQVTFTIATPSEYAAMLDHGFNNLLRDTAWSHACTGGEVVTPQLVQRFRKLCRNSMRLTNCYGPTEITAAATFQNLSLADDGSVTEEGHSVVGKALPNYSVYVTDHQARALPVGFVGEICVAGAGVAAGYLGLQAETDKKFICDPNAGPDASSRLYRTGDKGRLLEDGTLVFLGRLDDGQVKLRGLRIELDDIANNIVKAAPGVVAEAVASVRGEMVVAHVTFHHGASLSKTGLGELARSLPLPQYMIPSTIVALDHMPITANGKIDRRAIAALPLYEEALAPSSSPRLTLAEGELRILWQKILPPAGAAHDLTAESDFFMHGGNSALLIRLQAAIREAVGLSIPIVELYEASTLSKMAARISKGRYEQLPKDECIDWEAETALPDEMTLVPLPTLKPARIGGLRIALTGANSFVGRAILVDLLRRNDVQQVHCLAVAEEDIVRLPRSEKIISYTGSLLSPSLGLGESQVSQLQNELNIIIHAGANGHCLNNYSSLRMPNVNSTRFLVSLALPSRVPIHYLSSNRVTLLSGSMELQPVSLSSFPPKADGSEGFTSSKWASERFLERASEKAGLDIYIHRACAVTGAAAPNEDALNALLKFSGAMHAVPRFSNFEGYFDFKDVELVAKDVVNAVLDPDTQSAVEGTSKYVHHSSGKKVSVHGLKERMEELYGGQFEEVDVLDWIARASEQRLDPLIATYLETVVQKKEVVRFPYLGSQRSRGVVQ